MIGHSRLAAITEEADAVWIESVVVHPEARGKGVGKYLMLRTEHFCRDELGARKAYLCTTDQQIFYSRIGYAFCPPVTYYSGNRSLPKSVSVVNEPVPASKKPSLGNVMNKTVANAPPPPPLPPPSSLTKAPCPPPPPPPPLVPKKNETSVEDLKFEDISVTCSRVFRKLSLKDVTKVPLIEKPLSKLSPSKNKGLCKATMQKDYMVKIF